MCARVISIDIYLTHGMTRINLIKGTVANITTKQSGNFDDYGAKKGMLKAASLVLFSDVDLTVEYGDASIKTDMMSYNKVLRGLDVEEILITIDKTFVPDRNKITIVASDDRDFEYTPIISNRHTVYTNNLVANDSDWQNLFYRYTLVEKLKFNIFNNDASAKDIYVDIQHKEGEDGDSNDDWISYDSYPVTLSAGQILPFGDDPSRETRHKYHRVRVKTVVVGETSPVKGSMYGV